MRSLFPILFLVIIASIAACSPSATPTQAPASAPSPQAATTSAVSSSMAVSSQPTFKVEAFDDFFRPEKFTVVVGTQVTWVNVGKKNHTITYGNTFDVDIKPGESFSFTFDKPGTFQYYCVTHSESDHEGMVGTITVTEKK